MHTQEWASREHLAGDPLLVAAVLAAPPVWWLLAPLVGTARSGDLATVLMVVVLYPVLEELSFRGLLQGWLLQRLGGRHWSASWRISLPNLLTSLAFAAAHLPTQPIAWAAATLAPSLLFGFLRERYDSLLPPMALHIYYNAGLLLFVLYVQ
ncbi:MAG TPA: JDVT-CTERM system glutamic-type intramembrane protease [Burkholderiaceae bacterium]|nr:JDVT-CTERM system glutamic-type intramembrane protease [Burkholderiaceae bacterium]